LLHDKKTLGEWMDTVPGEPLEIGAEVKMRTAIFGP
jgi:hypothetical protein